MSLYKNLISFNVTLNKDRAIHEIARELTAGDLIANMEKKNIHIFSLYLSDTNLWLPILLKYRDEIGDYSFFTFNQNKKPMLQNLGFNIFGNDNLLFNIFNEYQDKDRSKSNFIELQSRLLEKNYDVEAGMNVENISEINLIYQNWIKNG